tara:strand:- start:268 stop:738 length:471 start_codon:yes stop_codon:yes gene_type:complete
VWEDILKNVNVVKPKGKTKTVNMPIVEDDNNCKEIYDRIYEKIKRSSIEFEYSISRKVELWFNNATDDDYCILLWLLKEFVIKVTSADYYATEGGKYYAWRAVHPNGEFDITLNNPILGNPKYKLFIAGRETALMIKIFFTWDEYLELVDIIRSEL